MFQIRFYIHISYLEKTENYLQVSDEDITTKSKVRRKKAEQKGTNKYSGKLMTLLTHRLTKMLLIRIYKVKKTHVQNSTLLTS